MMRRDAPSDLARGKYTSSVKYPTLPHSTIYGIVTMLVTVFLISPLTMVLGSFGLAYLLALTTAGHCRCQYCSLGEDRPALHPGTLLGLP